MLSVAVPVELKAAIERRAASLGLKASQWARMKLYEAVYAVREDDGTKG